MQQIEIILLVFDGFELLDMAGPASVFRMANQYSTSGTYAVTVASSSGGAICSSAGVVVETVPYREIRINNQCSVFTVGGTDAGLNAAMADTQLHDFLRDACRCARSYGSICSGAFLTAAAGVIDGCTVTTHWRRAQRLQALFPQIHVQAERLYIHENSVWSSAGVASGIDMALAIVEADFGRSVMSRAAKRLVVYAHRPGTQAQFSSVLASQVATSNRFSHVIAWISENIRRCITVADMAELAGMSERSFYRNFKRAVGMSPSKFLESVRLDQAKQLLEAGASIKIIPSEIGFASESGFRTAFEAKFHISPSQYRHMHGGTTSSV